MVNIHSVHRDHKEHSPPCDHYLEQSLFVINWRQALFLYYSALTHLSKT